MINLEPKLEAIHEAFADVADVLSPQKLDRYILSRLGAGVKTVARKSAKQLVTQRTGAMYRGVYSYYNKAKRQQFVTNNATNPASGARYPWILAAGHRRDTRSGKMLSFGERDWIEGPGNRYLYSNKADDDIEKVVNRELDKLKKRGVLK